MHSDFWRRCERVNKHHRDSVEKQRQLHARHLFKVHRRSSNRTLMMDGRDTAIRQATRSNTSRSHERNRAQSKAPSLLTGATHCRKPKIMIQRPLGGFNTGQLEGRISSMHELHTTQRRILVESTHQTRPSNSSPRTNIKRNSPRGFSHSVIKRCSSLAIPRYIVSERI